MQTESTSQSPSGNKHAALSPESQAVLRRHGMTAHAPDAHHLIIYAVPVPDCSKAKTNVLLRWESLHAGCRVFIDHDLQYLGDDPAMLETLGDQRQTWRQLRLDPVQGSPFEAMCEVLAFLRSPSADDLLLLQLDRDVNEAESLDNAMPDALHGKPNNVQLGRTLSQYANVVPTASLDAAFDRCDRKPLAQSIAAITRRSLGGCPLLWGEPGSGKDSLALAAASVVYQRGFVDRVLEISGARLSAGNIYWQDADSVLVRLLDEWGKLSPTLVLLRDFDLSSSGSWISYGLMSEAIDRGLRFIAIANDTQAVSRFRTDERFANRLVPVEIEQPSAALIVAALQRHADDAAVQLDAASIDMILHRSLDPDHKRPRLRIALAMLDAAITDIRWRSQEGGKRVLPDDVIAVTPPNWPADISDSSSDSASAGKHETE